jgi:hypothetical protein
VGFKVRILRSRNGGSAEGGAIELAMMDKMAVVFPEESAALVSLDPRFSWAKF